LAKKRPSLLPATKNSPRPGDKEKSNAKTNLPTPLLPQPNFS
jgi:hypothetical protein